MTCSALDLRWINLLTPSIFLLFPGNELSPCDSPEVRSSVHYLHIIDNQQTLFELSHRLEPRVWEKQRDSATCWTDSDWTNTLSNDSQSSITAKRISPLEHTGCALKRRLFLNVQNSWWSTKAFSCPWENVNFFSIVLLKCSCQCYLTSTSTLDHIYIGI